MVYATTGAFSAQPCYRYLPCERPSQSDTATNKSPLTAPPVAKVAEAPAKYTAKRKRSGVPTRP